MAENFVSIRGAQLTLTGSDFTVAGANCYYLGYCPHEAPRMAESVLDVARDMGLNVLRIWAFLEPSRPRSSARVLPWGSFFQYEDNGAIRQNDGPTGLTRLDRAIALAAERNIRLILVLTNSLPDLGGMDQYVRWLSPSGAPLFHDDFYDREDLCQAFERWIQHLVLRHNPLTGRLYRDEPTILAWELANEPRCHSHGGLPDREDCAASGRILKWVQRMSACLKTCDPNHLVAVGDEGFLKRRLPRNFLYDGSSGIDAKTLLEILSVDFGTFHLYPQAWKQNRSFGRRWIQQHLALARRAGKPMLLEEFGVSLGDGFVADAADRNSLYAEWLAVIQDHGGAGSLFWMLAGTGPDGQRFADADPFCLFDGEDAPSIVANARSASGRVGAFNV